jgi:hypothetical protein
VVKERDVKNRIVSAVLVFGLVYSLFLVNGCSGTKGSASREPGPKLSLEKADVLIVGTKVDTTYRFGARRFAATLMNTGSGVANDIRISIWPVFTDTLRIKLVPKEHYTKSIDAKSGDLYLTIPVLAQGDSINIYFTDYSLPITMKRVFNNKPVFPRFFMFHASCMQGSSVNEKIPTHWEGD